MSARPASGAELLCRGLAAGGVTHAFGLPGTQTIPLHEALRRSGLRSVLTTHELAAAFMANGFARASGRPAALCTIPGPGFAFALAGLAEARDDSVPLVHVVGRAASGRPHEFQALDQRAMAAPVVKRILAVERAAEAEARAAEAVAVALEDEPGPVLLEWSAEALSEWSDPRGAPARPPRAPPDAARLGAMEALLRESRRPLLLLGQGAAGAAGAARRLAEALEAPVLTTASGRGVLPEDHPLAMGFDFDRGGLDALRELLETADRVLAVGCKLGAAGTGIWAMRFDPDRLLRVDASAEVLASNHPARVSLAATAEEALGALAHALERGPRASAWSEGEVARFRARFRAAGSPDLPEPSFPGIAPPRARDFFAALQRALPRDAIVVTDSGTHQSLARRHLDVLSPGGLVLPSDFQSMGFGLPAALGAKLARPDRPVVALVGDGGFAMMGLELLTAVRERLAVPVVVFADGYLNRIRLQQLASHGRAASVGLRNPDFEGLAAALGAAYARVDGDPEATLRRALAEDGPTLVEVPVADSPAVQAARARGLARAGLRRGRGWLASLRGRRRRPG